MEKNIEIIINKDKKYILPFYSSLEEIIKFIKEESKLPKQYNIDLYGNDFSPPIKSPGDLEKLKAQSNKNNPYIRITFKVRDGIRENKNIAMNTPFKLKINPLFPKKMNIREIKKSHNENSETSEVKNSLREKISRNNIEKVDDNIKEEVKKYKQKQEEEIQSLEKELDELKRVNDDLENENDNNIFLSNDLIKNLKKDIINEIFLKISEELNEKMKEIEKNFNQEELIKNNEKYIDEQIQKKKENILHEIKAPFGEIKLKQKNIENKINNAINNANKKAIEENQKQENNQRQNNPNYKNFKNKNNISINQFNRGNNQIKNYKNQDQENVIDNEEINLNKCNHKINQSNNIHLLNDFVKNEPKKVNLDKFIDPKKNEPPLQKKKSNEINLFDLLNNIFFKDDQQKIINSEPINDNSKSLVRWQYIKYNNDGKDVITQFVKEFIEKNILPIFKQDNISSKLLNIVKYNISEILEAINVNRNYYSNYYFPQLKKGIKNRQKSVEASKKFRKEFNIGKDVINDEDLIKKLDENENDINKTFVRMYE